jgi:hypothetical protein
MTVASSHRGPGRPATASQGLSLAEWLLLCLVREQPTHGHALARLLRRDGSLGQIWSVPRGSAGQLRELPPGNGGHGRRLSRAHLRFKGLQVREPRAGRGKIAGGVEGVGVVVAEDALSALEGVAVQVAGGV